MRPVSVPLLALCAALTACGAPEFGEADVQGAIGEFAFGEQVTAYHGTSFIVIATGEIDCLDMSWVTRNYFGSNEATSSVPFGAVQFSFPVDETPTVGTFAFDSTQGDGPLDVWRLLNDNVPEGGEGTIDGDTAEAYTLTITEASEEAVVGTFDTLFADSNASGSFTTVHCRNVR